MAGSRSDRVPDPLGKHALFWVPSGESAEGSATSSGPTVALPVGKRALFSGHGASRDSRIATSANPLDARGTFTVVCERCRRDRARRCPRPAHLPVPDRGLVAPGRFDRRMTCPTCRRRSWCSVTLRRT